ncbi:hypothetical protein Q4Q49_16335 [Shewanella sp. SP1S1-7]|uniref:hypothetical protein n=1 Tax=unclassified Shewanella TaxID=196818 RepID=UPI00288F9235|nr:MULTISPECIES: hypothetical protein [unclassified Shewanella]MDT3322103.1 hypothetical protein [Shewanella sp. SP1S2-4]MDT3336857.1 hypothetical protein [Shewanella sp. SP1S1-7]
MQYPAWKHRALAALERQEQIEQNSGYDVRESLIAVSTIQQWVIENSCEEQAEFLTQLDAYFHRVRQNWPFPGEYNGGTATLGSCRSAIELAVLNQNLAPHRTVEPYRQIQPQVMRVASSPIRRWFKQYYPHWFMRWGRPCLKVEIKSFAIGLLISSVIFLLIYAGMYNS